MLEKIILILLITGLVVIAGCSKPTGEEVVIYKSPTCGCCVGYSAYLTGKNFRVINIDVQDMDAIRDRYGVPKNMESCHTMIIGDYFVEGHVPIEAVEKLLSEKPAIKGIALPRMPSGSPGMPGAKQGDFVIYSISDNGVKEFMRV